MYNIFHNDFNNKYIINVNHRLNQISINFDLIYKIDSI